MEIDKKPEHILLVFEGEVTEYKVYELLQKHGLGIGKEILTTFKAEIYQLYKQIIEDDADLFLLLQEKDKSLCSISKDNISAIFLFFDFDCHATQAVDEKVGELINYFNNETEDGKLFVSYPMVEAFKYFKQCSDLEDFLNLHVVRDKVCDFKEFSHSISNHAKTWQKMTKEDCQGLLKLHCIKANYLVNSEKELCDLDIEQSLIFNVYDDSDQIYVLSAFPLMLKYYFNHDRFIELIS